MPYSVRCKACSAVFAIPDEIWNRRVRGKMATLKCRSCKGDIQVDGTKANAGLLSESPMPAEIPSAAASPKPAAPIVAVAPAQESTPSPSPAAPASSKLGQKPLTKAPAEIAAADTGWSIMPPPADLESVGLKVSALKAPETPNALLPPTIAAPTISVADAAEDKTSLYVAPTPPPAASTTQSEATATHLWVVSYGDDDDRELTDKQVLAELARGTLNAATIVWREGMDEWLPISGVKELAKHLPAPKAAAQRLQSPATRSTTASKTAVSSPLQKAPTQQTPAQALQSKSPTQPKAAAPATTQSRVKPNTPGSTVPKQAATREKQPSSPQPTTKPTGVVKGPPPLARSTLKSSERLAPSAQDVEQLKTDVTTTVPWRKAQESSEEVLTSAPELALVSAHDVPAPAPVEDPHPKAGGGQPPPLPARRESPEPPPETTPAQAKTAPAATPVGAPLTSSPSQPSPRNTFRPPKPVETATALVRHTQHAPGADVLSITDDDFLAMQRRFPKWALPAAIAGGVILVGLSIYAMMSGEEAPPLPTAPVVVPSSTPRSGEGRYAQPDLESVPTSKSGGTGKVDGDFAKSFAQAAGKKSGDFDAKAAERSASVALEKAAKCRAGRDPAGQVRAILSISSAGRVTDVQVGAPHSSTVTGRCISKALMSVTVKPFQGESASLPLTLTLR